MNFEPDPEPNECGFCLVVAPCMYVSASDGERSLRFGAFCSPSCFYEAVIDWFSFQQAERK